MVNRVIMEACLGGRVNLDLMINDVRRLEPVQLRQTPETVNGVKMDLCLNDHTCVCPLLMWVS